MGKRILFSFQTLKTSMNERERRRQREPLIFLQAVLHSEGADPCLMRPENYTVFGRPL